MHVQINHPTLAPHIFPIMCIALGIGLGVSGIRQNGLRNRTLAAVSLLLIIGPLLIGPTINLVRFIHTGDFYYLHPRAW